MDPAGTQLPEFGTFGFLAQNSRFRKFPKIRGTSFGGPYTIRLIERIRLFRVLYWGPLFSETPVSELCQTAQKWERKSWQTRPL